MILIENELKLLRPFVKKEYVEDRKCYSEKEIKRTEARLQCNLPSPVKSIYMYMGDVLVNSNYLKPLELLHWECGYLGFFISPESETIIGISKFGDPNVLFKWENGDYSGEASDYLDEIEEYYDEGNHSKMKRAIQKYLQYWESIEKINVPSFSAERLSHEFRYNYLLDAYCIFLSVHAICEWAESLQEEVHGTYYVSDHLCFEENNHKQLDDLHQRIERIFTPISENTELLYKGSPILMAYAHKKPDALLVSREEDTRLTLLTAKKATQNFMEQIESQTGLKIIIQDT